jgi:hypothetical protein
VLAAAAVHPQAAKTIRATVRTSTKPRDFATHHFSASRTSAAVSVNPSPP